MISSISNTHANSTEQSSAPKGAEPKTQTQQKSTLPHDTVRLNSTPSDKPNGESK
jgi:hypothetical protein